ncbi:hypothetical protein [Gilliamella apicola]|uniref:hypothetical protein n=1 Tax=Gilliamella apicola TaxID=1196095 RepID=UPI000A330A03|nr:hypothetical protein [Gilliamella apicola]OTQ30709.1 hypothetical protein B6D03_00110 [Gilliamella apicola]
MAVCNFPKTSAKIGKTSTSCLRKFTIHFRRPDKLKQKQNAPYKGEYGFDWLRDEYIYPMEMVMLTGTYTELCTKPINLRKKYLEDVVPPGKKFQINGQDYYPAWLSIFACNVQGNNADAGSEMHKDGVYLDLQLDEIDKIIDDGTEIIFKPSDPCLKITPDKISISKFLKTTREKRILDTNTGKPEIHYYLLENAVKIICQGDTLKEHGKIEVFAKLGATEIEVGRLMVYQNNQIGKANIVVVNVITKDNNNKKVIPQLHPSLESLYNYQCFNQALIKTEIKTIENFDLAKLSENSKNKDVIEFLKDINDTNYMKGHKYKKDNNGFIIETKKVVPDEKIRDRLCELYDKYGKNRPKNPEYPKKPKKFLSINDGKHYKTYLFFTEISPYLADSGKGDTYGMAYVRRTYWGNMTVIYKKGLTDDYTIMHETAHSFSLTHTFEKLSETEFYMGYTENVMDYYTYELPNSNIDPVGQYKNKMYSFFKWQWDMIRKDQSTEIKK